MFRSARHTGPGGIAGRGHSPGRPRLRPNGLVLIVQRRRRGEPDPGPVCIGSVPIQSHCAHPDERAFGLAHAQCIRHHRGDADRYTATDRALPVRRVRMNLWRWPGGGPSPEPGVTTWLSAARQDQSRGCARRGSCLCLPPGGKRGRLPPVFCPHILSRPEPRGISPGKSSAHGAWIGSLTRLKPSSASWSLMRFSTARLIRRPMAGALMDIRVRAGRGRRGPLT